MSNRSLPDQRNPLLEKNNAPAHEILVERRCLGQTELKVKPGQVGTTNATKPDNLGFLDYAHLRVPLPKDLNSSGIFSKQANRKYPDNYFLMRRSTDGYISATGMFKAAFPWAQGHEEAAEKEYIKSLEATSSEEVAGNVWIDPEQALSLADEYGIRTWITALLDPEPIIHGTSDPDKLIRSPPPYRMADLTSNANGVSKSPTSHKKSASTASDGRRSTRGGPGTSKSSAARSESPTKKTPARKIATPRKPRGTKGRGKSAEPSEVLNGVTADDSKAADHDEEHVKVEITSRTLPSPSPDDDPEVDGEEETKIRIDLPAHNPALPLPQDPEAMLETAREMVAEAAKIEGRSGASPRGKRKAGELGEDGELESVGRGSAAKRARVEVELRKERIRRRALMGIAGSLAIGALVPSLMAAFGA